jgi:hypothetical protein
MGDLNLEYSCPTIDTDPFEHQPNNEWSIPLILIGGYRSMDGYIKIPYTMPQDHCLFAILREKDIQI